MSLILNIDTALDTAMISLAEDGKILYSAENAEQKDHAAWLHPSIEELMQHCGKSLPDLAAIAVSIGPGSYTGLRVGLSAAKGICYTLDIPLITVGTLEIIAHSALNEAEELICPLIDARRDEVFTAIYDKNLAQKMEPLAMILHITYFETVLDTQKILFCGNAVKKTEAIIQHRNARFSYRPVTPSSLASLSAIYLLNKRFTDVAYSEPLYIKEFYSSLRK
jgi:tRNA threonylcarbamoyladenosine biosynthesis protein TsaB